MLHIETVESYTLSILKNKDGMSILIANSVESILKGGKKNDFIIISNLLNQYSIDELIYIHSKIIKNQNCLICFPSALTYFNDAEDDIDPVSLQNQTWQSVKEFICNKVQEYLS